LILEAVILAQNIFSNPKAMYFSKKYASTLIFIVHKEIMWRLLQS